MRQQNNDNYYCNDERENKALLVTIIFTNLIFD